jgi:nucleoside-diphosphate-sugar epimerase
MRDVLILGCGYTGKRVAALLRARGARVVAADRDPAALAVVAAAGATVAQLDAARPSTWSEVIEAAASLSEDYAVLLSIPPIGGEGRDFTLALLDALPRPTRVVYLSTTAVYGNLSDVDESTAPQSTAEQANRLEVERVIADGRWSGMVLRAAAIYGPDRGLHVARGSGPRRACDPDRVVSRIHVDDLASICEAALESRATGAFPVADLEPATASEIAAFCLSVGLVPPALREDRTAAGRPARRVDARSVCRALGVSLVYPSYRAGIRATLP